MRRGQAKADTFIERESCFAIVCVLQLPVLLPKSECFEEGFEFGLCDADSCILNLTLQKGLPVRVHIALNCQLDRAALFVELDCVDNRMEQRLVEHLPVCHVELLLIVLGYFIAELQIDARLRHLQAERSEHFPDRCLDF